MDEYQFFKAMYEGKIKLAKMLYTKHNINIHKNYDQLFRQICNSGNLETAKWLYSLDNKINIHANNNEVFRYACERKDIKTAKWLTNLSDDFKLEIKSDIIISWKIIDSLKEYYETKKYSKIIDKLKIEKKVFPEKDVLIENDVCSICFGDNYNFITSCNHCFCVECFMLWYIGHDKKECAYCRQKIIIEKCIVKN